MHIKACGGIIEALELMTRLQHKGLQYTHPDWVQQV
jgi:hypothetical protein